MGKVKREGTSATVEMTRDEFNEVIGRLGHDPRLSDYSIVCEYVAKKVGMERAVRITHELNGLICFNFVPNFNQYLKEYYAEV